MTHDEQPRTVQSIATAGADSITRWRASKQATRASHYRRRKERVKESAPAAWLVAVERDDWRDEAKSVLPPVEKQSQVSA